VRNPDLVALGKILSGECGPEIMVVLTHQTENVGAHLSFESTVAWATALRGHKAFRSISTEPAEQPIYLAATYAEQHHGIFDPKLAALKPPQRVIS